MSNDEAVARWSELEKDITDGLKRRNRFKIIHMTLGLVIGIVGTVLAFVWFDWRLALVLFLLLWSNNIGMSTNKK